MRTVRLLFKLAGGVLFLALVLIVGFLLAAGIGAYLPRSAANPAMAAVSSDGTAESITIYLLSGLLHTDIVLPVNDQVRARFPELMDSRLPMDDPRLENLSFGWGSEAFYTTAGEYSDIRLETAWRAASGDSAVMRVVALPKLTEGENIRLIKLPPAGFSKLLDEIASGFSRDGSGRALYRPQYSIGSADAFFAAKGHFNLFNPCNQWTADMLWKSGIGVGRWTPTTYSLIWSLKSHGAIK